MLSTNRPTRSPYGAGLLLFRSRSHCTPKIPRRGLHLLVRIHRQLPVRAVNKPHRWAHKEFSAPGLVPDSSLQASTQHVAGSVPLVDSSGPGELRGRYLFNAVDYAPLMRAALINLDRWIVEGTAKVNLEFAVASNLPAVIPIVGNLMGAAADLLVLTKNQVFMVYRLAVAGNFSQREQI